MTQQHKYSRYVSFFDGSDIKDDLDLGKTTEFDVKAHGTSPILKQEALRIISRGRIEELFINNVNDILVEHTLGGVLQEFTDENGHPNRSLLPTFRGDLDDQNRFLLHWRSVNNPAAFVATFLDGSGFLGNNDVPVITTELIFQDQDARVITFNYLCPDRSNAISHSDSYVRRLSSWQLPKLD